MGEARELPVLTDDVIDLAGWVGGDPLWRAIAEIAAAMRSDEWLLIGGQMVALHGFVAGTVPPRTTTDIDIVAAVLVRRGALDRCADVLEAMDLRPQPSVTGKSLQPDRHRWRRFRPRGNSAARIKKGPAGGERDRGGAEESPAPHGFSSARTAASATCARTARIRLFSRVGWTRFVSRIT